ncbi:hypothetical protein FOA43_002443 [Brettanomyces nanus]|uniref:tRNA:m(4)X modification enzyme TRM13 n=1 Tax=Eeniella nana TaxID=13502 RepID=A0A875S4X1_EENNA|nr:uncharacterized protein FOA43_002443 [Brettanomyces nanus]QPG75102.1 hypothetical protein FOA43_002443 [Brettanomyces nanus]
MTRDSNAEKKIFKINSRGNRVGRIKCPLDPSHTIWEDKLKSHLGKCNAVRAKRAIEEKQKNCDWFDLNLNVKEEILDGNMKLTDENIDIKEFKDFLESTLMRYEVFFKNQSEVPEVPIDQQMYKEGLEERYEEISNKKHLLQQSSLIGQLVKYQLFSRENLYIEFGCGRGEFSRYLSRALDEKGDAEVGSRFLMVDRESPRMKMDNKIVLDSKCSTPEVHRLKVDIKDLKLSKAMENFSSRPNDYYVGISKHLCGVATDLTLRCLVNCMQDTEMHFKFKGFLVAMCCRHCCYYPWLLEGSKRWLKEIFGIDETNFKYLRKMCPWATNGTNHRGELKGKEHFSGMSLEEREVVGLKMRRILDTSRCIAMKEKGFKVQLVRYVPREVTFENSCMVIENDGIM